MPESGSPDAARYQAEVDAFASRSRVAQYQVAVAGSAADGRNVRAASNKGMNRSAASKSANVTCVLCAAPGYPGVRRLLDIANPLS